MAIQVVDANFDDPNHVDGLIAVLDAYAREPQGGGQPLSEATVERLPGALRDRSDAVALVAIDDGRVVGVAMCFEGFSTFAARPLLNLHDLAVLPSHRGYGIGRQLLAAVEERAHKLDCCKVTLEVLETNHGARRLYARLGFGDYSPGSEATPTFFLQKKLS